MANLIDTKEIIGIARKAQWEQIKDFIKEILNQTVKKEAGYVLVALDTKLKNSKEQELSAMVQNKKDSRVLDPIEEFSMLSLYQSNIETNDVISVTMDEGLIVMLAKYMGPHIDHVKLFDFSVQVDSSNDPIFTTLIKDEVLSCRDMINLMNKLVNKSQQSKPESKTKTIERKGIEAILLQYLKEEGEVPSKAVLIDAIKQKGYSKEQIEKAMETLKDDNKIQYSRSKPQGWRIIA
ncbi:MAG: hypothetical protein EU544_03435 [Promethearchaeota archaeon]|nr:MAG: hypothetical protein EU544_03435 [Candidatus Lokiarchaeota archaeon]